MKNKFKLKLINEYVKLYRLLFLCKILVLEGINKQMDALYAYSKATLTLKSKYESTFLKFRIDDDAFNLLKKELDDSIKQTYNFAIINNQVALSEIWETLIEIENTYNKVLAKTKI